jgi:hypothetical protein
VRFHRRAPPDQPDHLQEWQRKETMTYEQLVAFMTEGLDEAQAAPIREALKNEKIQSRAGSLRQQSELDVIEARARELDESLNKVDAQGNPVGYKAWYDKHWPAIKAQGERVAAYEQKYGTLEAPKNQDPPTPAAAAAAGAAAGLGKDEVLGVVNEHFSKNFAPNMAGVVKSIAKITSRHILAGRKTEVDFDAIEKIMTERGLKAEDAYAEWDKPEREKEAKIAEDKRVEQRVTEELQKRGGTVHMPDQSSGPGALSARSSEKFDRSAMERDLVDTFVRGEYTPGKTN